MKKKAVIFDLDNTIYSVYTIGEELFAPLFKLIAEDPDQKNRFDEVKKEMQTTPFQKVADHFGFSKELKDRGAEILKQIEFNGEMETFDDYPLTREMDVDKFLVTTGFLKMQNSKVRNLKLAEDFKEIHIVDPSTTDKTKRDVFADIVDRYGYGKDEVLVVGDDPNSEIKAALDLGIEAVLIDKLGRYPHGSVVPIISGYKDLPEYL